MKSPPFCSIFIAKEATQDRITPDAFWPGFAAILPHPGPRNRELLGSATICRPKDRRLASANKGQAIHMNAYTAFLKEMAILLRSRRPRGRDRRRRRGDRQDLRPQLVVPLTNARYALNAANARWGSLYDAFYGTDAIPHDPSERRQGLQQGARRQGHRQGQGFLDSAVPLATGSHTDVTAYSIIAGQLSVKLKSGNANPTLKTSASSPASRVSPPRQARSSWVNNGMHIEVRIDRGHIIGKDDPAGVADMILESASPPS